MAKAKQAAENAMQKIHEHKLQKLLAEMPKGWERTKILKIHAKQILDYYRKTNRGKVSEDEYQRRLAICKNCPDDKLLLKMSGAMICGKCSCNLNNINALPLLGGKAEWEALHCDMKHW